MKIRVDYHPEDTAVYVQRPDGDYVGVYVGDAYRDDVVVIRQVSKKTAKTFGKTVWKS